MATGLVALIDDVAAIAKLAAASLDDVAGAAGRAGTKAAGVVVDDAAVTPRYVTGLTPDRELPIIGRIALGSLRNKLVVLLPAAMVLSAFAPWAIAPLLMAGAAYLCFEGAEKLIEALSSGGHDAAVAHVSIDPAQLERDQVRGAVRTDFILSAEIVAISLADVADQSLLMQAAVLVLVSLAITGGVYGVVALIVKMDDIGLRLARSANPSLSGVGRGLVRGMPILLKFLGALGTAAMLWVGGGIILHGLEGYGFAALPHAIHHFAGTVAAAAAGAAAIVEWLVNAAASGVFGSIVGGAVVALHHSIHHLRRSRPA